MLNKEINNLAIQVKAILESEERSYIDKNQKIDIYNHIMNEATSMMRQKPKNKVIIDQRKIDRAEFNYYYNKWRENTLIFSDLNVVYKDPNYKKIEQMGRRALPFIYEKLKIDYNLIIHAVPVIYNQNISEGNGFISQDKYLKLCLEKIEKEGDV